MTNVTRQGGSAAAVLDFAVAQILRDDTALGALPAVLARLVAAFGLDAALAFQPSVQLATGQLPAVLAMHPPGAVDQALLARIGALTLAQRDTVASPLPVTMGGQPASALLAHSAPVGGQCLCALALIGDAAGWDAQGGEVRVTAHAVAAIVATQIRHANDMTTLAERQALTRALITGAPIAILAMDAGGRLVELRVATLRADGTERVAELTPVQITLGGGTIFTGFLRDLTETERSHAALADQTERLNCLITSAIPGVLITDEHGTVTNLSQSFGTMFGLAEPPVLAGASAVSVMRRIDHLFADPVRFTRRAVAMFRARQPTTGEQIQCADGRTVEWDYWPVLVDGRYRGDIWLAWDMSDRTKLEQQRLQMLEAELAARQLAEQTQHQLAEQNERLRQLDEARNQFLAIVSHELRTPLTSIISFSELIRGEAGGLTPDGVLFLDIIERNADRLHRLVGDLLMLDRLESGGLPLDLAPVSIADLAAEAVRSASAGAARQDITIDLTTGQGPPVPGDQRRLMQVLDNLIANAVKFSHRNQRVHVKASCDGSRWRIDVTDSGIGIPPEEAGQLFNRFVRASNARTAGLPGTGLGLSIVKVLVEMHGGHVEVASTLGRGSTFSVFLPGPA